MNIEAIIAVVIIILFLGLGIWLGICVRKAMNNNYSRSIDFNRIDAKSQLVKHIPYLWPKELEFYEMYKKILPKEYLIVPKVGVDKIVKPHGSLVMYNAIKTKYVDFCIFKVANMEPIAVIDCYYPSITDSNMKEMDIAIKKSLEAMEIPVLTYEILDVPYDEKEVIQRFYDALDPVALAQLRKKQ